MIDPRAIIDKDARLASDVVVGPWSIIGPDVEIGAGTVIGPHVVIARSTRIGCNNRIYQFATIGEDCQDKKYHGETTYLEIGDHNIIREGCTLHRGTVQDKSLTRIGNHNLLMAYVHIAHDCIVGDHTVFANNATLGGHVQVADWAILGGYTLVHQFCQIGGHAFCGTGSVVLKDIPAYVMVNGNSAKAHGINSDGLRRRNFSDEQINTIRRAYRILYREGHSAAEAIEQIAALVDESPVLLPLLESLRGSTRGIVR
ncbi:MAG TPA: acyl-ACP--UDP-N-acetylglucosamine O-acyltransferase [Pseudomonadales bacterium]|nr:acyl-ACP--UDP-N-acetylglucosamine O-acyltransferase [Pseudomonadales bacterium]HMW82147.1 acyl-ACP--UDP-N-acetylglucosamine O-acyltransferase [Pseudomonadales bacterium]HMY96137.1 acyl-ACP--UDP-N-acetylglucosamine O-acyltransferase [Pseudomonadales bacterium]HNB82837.1 acyl-ACP--UDP-N-acetylglucosamine O-acyltransferase [Pseudomonadales bacterium]HNH18333.1 acyl-ACP--UDP-N-acetylglucosamine O-acyltransferase [Pseudomonadales bacterium]